MAPANQRFDPDDPPGRGIDLRLVEEEEFTFGEAVAQFGGQGDPGADFAVHGVGKEALAAAAGSSISDAITANSSPPKRATRSVLRTPSRRRSATWHSSRSPIGWLTVS